MYWFLGILLNQQKLPNSAKLMYEKKANDETWTVRVPKLMKKLIILLDQNPAQVEVLEWPASLPNVDDEDSEASNSSDVETMDTITVNFLLRKVETSKQERQLQAQLPSGSHSCSQRRP